MGLLPEVALVVLVLFAIPHRCPLDRGQGTKRFFKSVIPASIQIAKVFAAFFQPVTTLQIECVGFVHQHLDWRTDGQVASHRRVH